MGRARRLALTFIAALVAGSLVNVVIETGQPAGARAVAINDSGDLGALAAVTQRSVRINYAFTATLHDLARGGALVVSDPDLVASDEIENLSLMKLVVEQFDPSIPARLAVRLEERATISGEGALRRDGPETTWSIVTDGTATPGLRLRLVFFEDAAFVVDERLLAELQSS